MDRRKLADSIAQLRESVDPVALICSVPDNADAWAHLTAHRTPAKDGDGPELEWHLTVGFPTSRAEPLAAIAALNLSMSLDLVVTGWEQGVYAQFTLPAESAETAIALLIERIMVEIQEVPPSAQFELALESE